MTVMFNTEYDGSGKPIVGKKVYISLLTNGVPGYGSDFSVESVGEVLTDETGRWEADLVPNDEITPAGSVYMAQLRFRGGVFEHNFIVPVAAGTQWIGNYLSEAPNPLPSSALNAHIALTTGAHGGIVSLADPRLTDERVPLNGSVTDIKIVDVSMAKVSGLSASLAALQAEIDNDLVKLFGNQTIDGLKDFTTTPTVNGVPIGTGSIVDADASTKGILRLAGDLGGTAALPTVPALASKADLTDARFTDERTPLNGSVTTVKLVDLAVTDAKINDIGMVKVTGLTTALSGKETAGAAAAAQAFAIQRANHTGVQAISTVTALQATLDDKETLAGSQAKADAAQAFATQRGNHTGTQLAATISDLTEAVQDAIGGAFADTATIDLTYNDTTNTISGIVLDSPTVAGVTPSQLRDRTTHTGTQTIATISGLQAALDSKEVAGAAATAQAFSIQRVNHTGVQAIATITGLQAALDSKANDVDVVKLVGDQTIAGVKTFSASPIVPSGAFPQLAIVNLTTDLASKLPLVGGTLTGPLVLAANASAALHPVPLQQLDSALIGVRAGTIYIDDYIASAGATTTTTITNAIKTALAAAKAAGKWCEFAPRAYTVNQSLDPINTLIRAYGATITLAAGSNCYLLACSAGANVTIFGGLWDGNNNAGQQTTGVGFIGYGFYLVAPGPSGLTGRVWLKDVTVNNCIKWAIATSAAQEVRWENLRFNTQSDGIHVHAPCSLVRGRGVHGPTGDDLVACTTSDYPANVTTEGDFGVIDIEGFYQTGAAPSFAFLGKTGTKAETIRLSNFNGTAGGMAIRITNDTGSSGNLMGTTVGSLTIDGIEVDNANSVSPIINLNPTSIRNVVIINFIHRNTGIPILVDTAGVVESLKVNGYSWKPLPSSPSSVQTIGLGAATAGTVTITFDGATTAAIARNATAATIQAALVALPNVDTGDIVVTGGPWPATATLTWGGRFVGKWQPKVVVTPTGLTGGTVTVTVTTDGGGVAQPLVQNLGRCDELVFESVAATFVSGGKVFQNGGSIHRVSMSNMLTSGGTAILVQNNTSTPMDVFEANSQFRNLEFGHIIGAVFNLYMDNVKINGVGNYLFSLNDTGARVRILAGVVEQLNIGLPQSMAGASTISANGEMLIMDATGGNQINAARAGDRVWDRITNKPVIYNGSAWVAAY